MSWEQLEKLQNLEVKQDFLEVENNQMSKCIEEVRLKNNGMVGNIMNLESKIAKLSEENKETNLALAEKDAKLDIEIESSKHWKSEYEDILQSCQKKQQHVEKLEYELFEMQNLILEYESSIEKLTKESINEENKLKKECQKKNDEYLTQIDLFESRLMEATEERNKVIQQNKKLEDEISSLEMNNKTLIEAMEDKIDKNYSFIDLRKMESGDDMEENLYIRKLRKQLQETESMNLMITSKQDKIISRKYDLENIVENTGQSKRYLANTVGEKVEENLILAALSKENEDDMTIVMKKFKTSVAALSSQQIVLDQQYQVIESLEAENQQLRDKVLEMEREVADAECNKITKNDSELKLKLSTMEGNLEFERESNIRLKQFLERAKTNLSRSEAECANLLKKNELLSINTKNMQRQIKTLKNDLITLERLEARALERKVEVERKIKLMEADNYSLKYQNDLTNQRIEGLKISLFLELASECDYNLFERKLVDFNDKHYWSDNIESEC